jgi:ABC-type antimicrobial peptide transport system permease subunit
MFSGVVDNLREFGMLKAIGATTWDLAAILVLQAAGYAIAGSGIGLLLVGGLARGIRSPALAVILPPWLIFGAPVVMLVVCISASALALRTALRARRRLRANAPGGRRAALPRPRARRGGRRARRAGAMPCQVRKGW